MTNRYRTTRIQLGFVGDEIIETDLGTVDRNELKAMAKLPGWHMVRESDSEVWLNVDGLGWERLHVAGGEYD